MSILSDKEIKELCEVNTHVLINGERTVYFNSDNYLQKLGGYFYKSFNADTLRNNLQTLEPGNHVDYFTSGVIVKRLVEPTKPMISPFVDRQVKVDEQGNKLISYGLSSSGYDLRIAPEFKVFSNINSVLADPKDFDTRAFIDINANEIIIPPNSFVLSRSLERFTMPRNVCAIVVGKSTLARVGISCLCTPLENEWEGYLTLEFANVSSIPVKLYANNGGAQVMFFRNDVPPAVSYADRSGKYSNQPPEIVLAKV